MKNKRDQLIKAPCLALFDWKGAETPEDYQSKGKSYRIVYEHPVGAGAMRLFYEGAGKQTVAAMEAVSW